MSSASAARKRSRSAIMADTESGHHLLTIHGYSRTMGIPTGERVSSVPFTIGGHRWCIDYFPNGRSPEFADYVSLSLHLDGDVAKTVKAQYDICLAGQAVEVNQEALLASKPVHNFTLESGRSLRAFIKRKDLEISGHLTNDSFTIRCDIVVIHGCRARAQEHEAAFSVPPCDLRRHLGELLETEKGADVVFEVGGETVAAHRCVLAARSSVFSAELFGPMKEGNAASILVRIEDMEMEVFKMLLRFAYTDSLPDLRKEDEDVMCQHLLVAADRYAMERLKIVCEEKLCEYINVGTVATILTLAEQHHCEGLKKACFDFLGSPTNLKAVITTDGFQHLSRSCPSLMVEIVAMSLAPYQL